MTNQPNGLLLKLPYELRRMVYLCIVEGDVNIDVNVFPGCRRDVVKIDPPKKKGARRNPYTLSVLAKLMQACKGKLCILYP
jgi:hypothetical protein